LKTNSYFITDHRSLIAAFSNELLVLILLLELIVRTMSTSLLDSHFISYILSSFDFLLQKKPSFLLRF